MMSATQPAAGPDSGAVAALTALIPSAVGACAAFGLRAAGAGEFADVAATAVTIIVGLPFLRRTTRRDEERTATGAPFRSSAAAQTAVVGHGDVVPCPTTVVLWVVLVASAFWLTNLLTTWMGAGSLGYLTGKVPDDASVMARSVALRSLVVFLPVVFLVAVATGHRLRARAAGALNLAVLLYAVVVLACNQLLLGHRDHIAPGRVERIPEDIYLPIVCGLLTWLVCRLGLCFAARSQERYDAAVAARLDMLARTRR